MPATAQSPMMKNQDHPLEDLIRSDRIPHIWCPGCGIGTAFSSCLSAMKASGRDLEKMTMVSGIGCSGRAAGYVKLDSFHTTHGRAIPFATGLKLGNPDLDVVVFSGDGDLFAIGGNHFIHAARRNMDLTVICLNNLNYGMTGPSLRASGIAYDVRKARPYLGYETYDFDVPVGVTGDCYDRYLVRLEEMRQSIRILHQALDRLPDGPLNIDDPAIILPPKSAAMSSIDSMIVFPAPSSRSIITFFCVTMRYSDPALALSACALSGVRVTVRSGSGSSLPNSV